MSTKSLNPADNSSLGLGKVILIGLAAGLIGTLAKTLCETISAPRPPGVPSPLGNALDAVSMSLSGHPMLDATKSWAEPVVHFLFGMGSGAAYAVLARKVPLAAVGYGAAFGFSFWLVAHEIVLPLIGLSPTPAQMTLWEQGDELISHLIFGMIVESIRRIGVRKLA